MTDADAEAEAAAAAAAGQQEAGAANRNCGFGVLIRAGKVTAVKPLLLLAGLPARVCMHLQHTVLACTACLMLALLMHECIALPSLPWLAIAEEQRPPATDVIQAHDYGRGVWGVCGPPGERRQPAAPAFSSSPISHSSG